MLRLEEGQYIVALPGRIIHRRARLQVRQPEDLLGIQRLSVIQTPIAQIGQSQRSGGQDGWECSSMIGGATVLELGTGQVTGAQVQPDLQFAG